MLSPRQFQETHAKLAATGGFTVNPRTGADITSGFSVAPRGNERKLSAEDSTPEALQRYASQNTGRWTNETNAAGEVTARHNAVLGGWRSEDPDKGSHDDYLDTPTVYKNTPAGETAARKSMVFSGQEAGFHLDTFQEKMNPFHPETRRKLGMESHELADIAGRGRAGAEFAARQPEVQAWVNSPRNRAAAMRAPRSGGRP